MSAVSQTFDNDSYLEQPKIIKVFEVIVWVASLVLFHLLLSLLEFKIRPKEISVISFLAPIFRAQSPLWQSMFFQPDILMRV